LSLDIKESTELANPMAGATIIKHGQSHLIRYCKTDTRWL